MPRLVCYSVCLIFALTIRPLPAKQPVEAHHGMVVAQEPIAANAGVAVLQKGGNAVDAAVAVGFTLAVTHPSAGNIGGGGFMLIRLANGKTTFLDFRETAPGKASQDMYIGADGNATKDSIYGWRASGVPGSIAGFAYAREKFGTQAWADLLQPAVHLAQDGFPVSDSLARSLRSQKENPLQQDSESKRVFQRNGEYFNTGEILRQPELAATLERVAKNGPRDFYAGATARQLATAMAAHGGLITLSDLQNYKVIESKTLEGDYEGFHLITAPPPSAGGVGILQMMGMLAGTKYNSDGPNSAKAIHFEAEAMRRFYADRSEYLGDPAYYNVPVDALLSPRYLAQRRATIHPLLATPSDQVQPGLPKAIDARNYSGHESSETTHFNVVDKDGNAVAVTYTLNNSYGSGITVPGLGFLLNDEMDDFVAKPGSPNMFGLVGGEANAITPGKRPLSSMTPTIITENGKLKMVVGAPGGSRITTGVMQVILDVLDFGMNPQEAVDLPRFHQQWKPDILYLESGINPATGEALQKMGYPLKPVDGVARVEAITVKDGALLGGTQSRYSGKVAGY